jgi:hypothetical protein
MFNFLTIDIVKIFGFYLLISLFVLFFWFFPMIKDNFKKGEF